MATRAQPYRLDLGHVGSLDVLNTKLSEIVTNADQMFQELYEDLSSAQDGVDAALNTVVNDTNVTGVISGSTLTLGWTGTLSVARGGSGRATATAYAVICGGTTATGAHQSVSGVGTSGQVLTSNGAAALPTWQATASPSGAALTRVSDTNVTLTLGGTPTTALLQATSITVGWSGTLAVARGGTGVGALGDITRVSDTNVTLTLGGTPTGAVITSTSFTLGWSGTLAVTRGGTGLGSLSQGDLIYGSAANTFSALAKNTTATRYLSNTGTSNNPAWAQVDLSNGVTGVLPSANGGTNSSTDSAVLTARLVLSEAQLEAFDATSGTSITMVAAAGSDKVIMPIGWSCEVNVTTGYGNNPSFRARWGTDTTFLPLADLQTPGFNVGAAAVRYTTNVAQQVTAFSRATFDPRNKALVVNLTAALTSPGTGVATAVITVSYYIAQFT